MNGYNDPNQDDDDESVSPAFEGFINLLIMVACLTIIVASLYGLFKWSFA
jgi:hypothetical protein